MEKTCKCQRYIVDDYEWEPTPAWQVRWLGRKLFRQHHAVIGMDPPGYWTYAEKIPDSARSSVG